nr:hypothetical protein [Tanacetum cinerariifolium]
MRSPLRSSGPKPKGNSMRPPFRPAGPKPHGPSVNPRRPTMIGIKSQELVRSRIYKEITCSCFHGFIDKDLMDLVIPDVRSVSKKMRILSRDRGLLSEKKYEFLYHILVQDIRH